MYKAYVTKIFTEPAPGFDNLVLGRCKGYQVLVGKETANGQLGVFFGTDGQLSEEFAKMNDLIRRKNPDGSKAGGMFEENRRVKAIKMKGIKSDGFWCPLSLFEYTGFDLSTLKEGDQFDELNGNVICNKYETPATIKAKNRAKEGVPNVKILKNLATFPEHIETGHFVREAQLIKPGALIMISDKLHGCLTYGEMITMADGSKKAIIDVKQGDFVLGLDKYNTLVPSKVLQKFDGGKSPGWLQVKIERQPIGYSNKYLSVKCTPEHWFFVKEKQDYVCAKDLNPGDTVITVANAEQEIKPSNPFLIERKVLEISPCKIKSQRYDMETETHNYFANKVLVHNTSHRVTTTLCTVSSFYNKVEKFAYKLFVKYPKTKRVIPFLKRFKHFCFNYLSTKVWLKINGTRHTVMEFKEPGNLGFYGNDEFRYRITEKFTPHKNEVIYGEIVGYTDSGAAIMKRHNTTVFKSKEAEKRFGKEMTYKYGCLEGTCDFYVYRICSVNEDGIVTEYSWPQVVRRCQELGLKTVPVLETFIYDGNEEALRKKVDVMVNGESGTELVPDPLDNSHIQEGVVVRYENPNGRMDWLKHKAWAFGVMEGHLKLDDNFVDLEEIS